VKTMSEKIKEKIIT